MTIKERKQITGTAAQIKAFAGHKGVLAYATDTKHLHVLSGTAGTTTELANKADIPNVSGKADTTYVKTELAKKANASHTHTTAQVTGLDTALADKAPKSHTHTIANVTGLQTDLTTIRESITNVSSKVDGIGDTLSPTYAKKQGILDACDKALNGANPVHAGDPTLDDIKSALATIQAQLGQLESSMVKLESRRYVKEAGKSSDGLGWYRKWSDGFIEQGGRITSVTTTISLHTAFTNTNYTISSSQAGTSSARIHRVAISDRTTSKFNLEYCEANMLPISWNACGY
jgi:hypothetical protein